MKRDTLGLWSRLKAAVRMVWSGGGGGIGYSDAWWADMRRGLAGTEYDYKRGAGRLWESSIVLPCLKWITRTWPEAPPIVGPLNESGAIEPDDAHPLAVLLRRPNPFYTGSTLWAATLTSLIVDGNAYWLKVRSARGAPVELWYLPHFMVSPLWPQDGSAYLSGFRYRVNGQNHDYAVEDVVHFRDGIDPENTRRGLSPLAGVFREVCTDNERATAGAAILRNMGIAGAIISPKDDNTTITPDQAEAVKRMWREQFTGDRRGEPFVASLPLDLHQLDVTIADLALDKLASIPEERITAAIGIPAAVVGFGAGLSQTKVGATMKELREQAFESCVIPLQRLVSEILDAQLLPDFDATNRLRCGFDLRQVRVLQEDRDALAKRITAAVGAPWMTPNEGRAEYGLDPIDGGDELAGKPEPEEEETEEPREEPTNE